MHPAVTSAVLGHSSPAFTMSVYQHILDGMGQAAADALERALQEDTDEDMNSGEADAAR